MKKILILLAAALLLSGCQKAPAVQTRPQTDPTVQSTCASESGEASVDIGIFEDTTTPTEDTQTISPTVSQDPLVPGTTPAPSPTEPSQPTETTPSESIVPPVSTAPVEGTDPTEKPAPTQPETEDSGYYTPILRP